MYIIAYLSIFVAVFVPISAAIAYLLFLLYNYVMPDFGFPVLTFYKVWALTFILQIVGSYFRSIVSKKD